MECTTLKLILTLICLLKVYNGMNYIENNFNFFYLLEVHYGLLCIKISFKIICLLEVHNGMH